MSQDKPIAVKPLQPKNYDYLTWALFDDAGVLLVYANSRRQAQEIRNACSDPKPRVARVRVRVNPVKRK